MLAVGDEGCDVMECESDAERSGGMYGQYGLGCTAEEDGRVVAEMQTGWDGDLGGTDLC